MLSDNATVDVMIVQYNASNNLTDEIENAAVNAYLVVNASSTINASCAQNQQQSGGVFILNSPVYDANAALTITVRLKFIMSCMASGFCICIMCRLAKQLWSTGGYCCHT